MSVLVKNFSDFFKILVQSFNLSSTFPATILVLLLRMLILQIPDSVPLKTIERIEVAVQTGGALLAIALISYLLDAANIPIIRFFEGYPFRDLPLVNRLERSNKKFVAKNQAYLKELSKVFDELVTAAKQEKDPHNRQALRAWAEEVYVYLIKLSKNTAGTYPEDPEFVLPFRFGNVIAAAEYYPYKAFGMNAVTLWPFLAPILTSKNYAQFVLREKAVMDFLLNMSLVFISFSGILALTGMIYGFNFVYLLEIGTLVLWSSLLAMLSVQAAASWGATIKAAFVLHREDLRRALRLRTIHDYKDERVLWENSSNFFRALGSPEEQMEWGIQIFDSSSYAPTADNKEA